MYHLRTLSTTVAEAHVQLGLGVRRITQRRAVPTHDRTMRSSRRMDNVLFATMGLVGLAAIAASVAVGVAAEGSAQLPECVARPTQRPAAAIRLSHRVFLIN